MTDKIQLSTNCRQFNSINDMKVTIIVDKEKLRQELMQLMANCEDCDVPLPRCQCSERPCKFGINDRKIEEIIQNSIIIEGKRRKTSTWK